VVEVSTMREFTLNDLVRRAGEILEAVERGEVIILRWWERRIALLCPYPRGYRMDADRFRAILKRTADEIADAAQDLPGPGGPRLSCHQCGRPMTEG
jgi:antitoxin (DNA-binding transcriptional repressor) of toxin-antitoxin stability system